MPLRQSLHSVQINRDGNKGPIFFAGEWRDVQFLAVFTCFVTRTFSSQGDHEHGAWKISAHQRSIAQKSFVRALRNRFQSSNTTALCSDGER